MAWIDDVLMRLVDPRWWAYEPGGTWASEPAALAAIALIGHGREEAALHACTSLADRQAADGSLGVTARQGDPHWPTALAVLAWKCAERLPREQHGFRQAIDRATLRIVSITGKTSSRSWETGHNSMLVGWPWVEGTHSWIEPTAWCVLALKATGQNSHPRAREGVRVLIDRQLSFGGCNYGNTTVFGQRLRPHQEPSGLALAALAGEAEASQQVQRAAAYLESSLSERTTSMSLSYGLLGLAAARRTPDAAPAWLEAAAARSLARAKPLHLALLALAALGTDCPLLTEAAWR